MKIIRRIIVFLIFFGFFLTSAAFGQSRWEKFKSEFNNFDDRAVIYINHSTNSDICDGFMIFMTMLGDGRVIIPMVGLILYFHDKKNFKYNFTYFMTILIIGGLVIQILKYIFNRPRPLQRIHDIKLLSPEMREHGFPSGHTQAIFTSAVFLSKTIKKRAWIFFAVAMVVGISRIYVGVHYLSDVIAGAIIGIILTESYFWFFKFEKNTGNT
ncbi:MAG: hypothetical protein A2252_01425 [Elusimicrobia bacterium RIFOXYA2_FULL_39_19]|nr:MAG: hypothetical protein A2252_01425 [Elusimicrobia bacterium RIFOXYA2_FULL_39_19]